MSIRTIRTRAEHFLIWQLRQKGVGYTGIATVLEEKGYQPRTRDMVRRYCITAQIVPGRPLPDVPIDVHAEAYASEYRLDETQLRIQDLIRQPWLSAPVSRRFEFPR